MFKPFVLVDEMNIEVSRFTLLYSQPLAHYIVSAPNAFWEHHVLFGIKITLWSSKN